MKVAIPRDVSADERKLLEELQEKGGGKIKGGGKKGDKKKGNKVCRFRAPSACCCEGLSPVVPLT